jgi:transcriptional regulator with XRE-family HTH domain
MHERSHMVNYDARGNVHPLGNDARAKTSHSVNMAKRRTNRDIETLEDLRRTSGWYLAAWRDYRQLSLDELAAQGGVKKSALSELENGRVRADGRKPRFNRDTIVGLCEALGITEGMLFDVNPMTANPDWLDQYDAMRKQGPMRPDMVLRTLDAMATRRRA